MAEGLIDAIRALLSGGGGQKQAPPDPNEGIDPERPWASPVLRPKMAQEPLPTPPPSPPPPPATMPSEDALEQAQRFIRQRELMKRMLPQEMWNK